MEEEKETHTQEWVKVNTHVDSEIVGLIQALSAFPKLQTIESCQNISDGASYVCFYYGNYWEHPWKELAEFVLGYIGPRLAQKLGDRVSLSIYGSSDNQAYAELTVRKGALRKAIKALKQLNREFNI